MLLFARERAEKKSAQGKRRQKFASDLCAPAHKGLHVRSENKEYFIMMDNLCWRPGLRNLFSLSRFPMLEMMLKCPVVGPAEQSGIAGRATSTQAGTEHLLPEIVVQSPHSLSRAAEGA